MEHHRKCEACNRGTCTEPKATHLYLKRRSVSSIISKKSTKSSGSESKRSSYIDTSTAETEEMYTSNPPPANATHVTVDHDAGTDDTDFNERIEAAEHRLYELLVEARRPLTESKVVSAPNTIEEQTETDAASQWAEQNEKVEQALADAEQKNERLLKDVNAAVDAVYDDSFVNPVDDFRTFEPAPVHAEKAIATRVKEDQYQPESTNEQITDRKSDSLAVPVSERPATPPPQPTLSSRPADSTVPAQRTSNVANNAASATTARKPAKQGKNDGWHTLWSFNYNTKW